MRNNKWISVNEDMPQVKYDRLGNYSSKYVLIQLKEGGYQIGYLNPHCMTFEYSTDMGPCTVCSVEDVVAWMPLPEPYSE